MKPQDEFGSSFETAKELPETSWKRKAIQAASSQAEPIRTVSYTHLLAISTILLAIIGRAKEVPSKYLFS